MIDLFLTMFSRVIRFKNYGNFEDLWTLVLWQVTFCNLTEVVVLKLMLSTCWHTSERHPSRTAERGLHCCTEPALLHLKLHQLLQAFLRRGHPQPYRQNWLLVYHHHLCLVYFSWLSLDPRAACRWLLVIHFKVPLFHRLQPSNQDT